MEYAQLRKNILQYLGALQEKGFSYQSICDYINQQQTGFVLFKDFFSRFQSKATYYKSPAKQKKLSLIHQNIQNFYHQNLDEEDSINEILKSSIHKAAEVKFETYLEINRSVKSNNHPHQLSQCYLENSPAYLNIQNDLKHRRQYEWELDILNYGSTFKVLSVQTINLFNQNAVVATKEFWKLCWVDKTSKKLQFKFESLGEQTYLLSKDEEDRWKIVENKIMTQSSKIEPEYIDYEVLEGMCSRNQEENKKIAADFLTENDLLHCIAFIKICYLRKLTENQISLLTRVRKSFLNSRRLLNTDAINFTVYRSEVELLNKQLKLICDGIFISNKGVMKV